VGGPEHSTLSNDAFRAREFDFMLSNPPYGKSWKSDLERMGGKGSIKDPRFVIEHEGDPEYSLLTRSSDGQMLFLANMLSKMKRATQWYRPLRKNLGKKNCELAEEDIGRICDVFLRFEESEQSRIFPNAALGYWKVTVERPLRLAGIDPGRVYASKEIKALKDSTERKDDAPPVIKKVHKKGTTPDPLCGLFAATVDGKPAVVEYEPDPDLRDTEQIPLLEEGGIDAFLRREVLPYAPDAWYDPASVKTGYEISFTRYFYQPQPLRTLAEIRADILALEAETEGLLKEIIEGV
jgi:type I restriction enzyme M protein